VWWSWTPQQECIDPSGQFFPPSFLLHLVGVVCQCGRELNSGTAGDKGSLVSHCLWRLTEKKLANLCTTTWLREAWLGLIIRTQQRHATAWVSKLYVVQSLSKYSSRLQLSLCNVLRRKNWKIWKQRKNWNNTKLNCVKQGWFAWKFV